MLEFLDAPKSVMAIRVSHKIMSEDLDAIMDRLDQLLRQHDKVHLFVETHSIDGIELTGLARYSARAMPLFGKLKQLVESRLSRIRPGFVGALG